MKGSCNLSRISYVTLGAGILGIGLRLWLYATGVDHKGLLLENHPAGILSFVLTAVFVAWLFWLVKGKKLSVKSHAKVASFVAAAGCMVAGAAVGAAGVKEYMADGAVLSLMTMAVCLCAGVALIHVGLCRLQGRKPAQAAYVVMLVAFILLLISHYRGWSKEPQLQAYFFSFMAGMFLLFSVFCRAVWDMQNKGLNQMVYANQMALFLCCMSVMGDMPWFYLAMALWMAADTGITKGARL